MENLSIFLNPLLWIGAIASIYVGCVTADNQKREQEEKNLVIQFIKKHPKFKGMIESTETKRGVFYLQFEKNKDYQMVFCNCKGKLNLLGKINFNSIAFDHHKFTSLYGSDIKCPRFSHKILVFIKKSLKII